MRRITGRAAVLTITVAAASSIATVAPAVAGAYSGIGATPKTIIRGNGSETPLINRGTNTCISSLGGGAGTQVELYGCNGSPNQQWSFGNNGVIQNGGDGLCISDNGYYNSGTNLYMEPCNNSPGEQFYAEPDGAYYNIEATPALPENLQNFSSRGRTGNNQPVQLWGNDSSYNQEWAAP